MYTHFNESFVSLKCVYIFFFWRILYLYNGKLEIKVTNINNNSEKFLRKHCD